MIVFSPDPDFNCGELGFKLVNDTQAGLVSLTEEGIVTTIAVTDASLHGSHTVQFEVYLKDLDSNATITFPVDITMNVVVSDISLEIGEYFANRQRQEPEAMETIQSVYLGFFNKTSYADIKF